jgi:carbohydrate binding protein with CBM4/9 domain
MVTACSGKSCGTAPDGCGGSYTCGLCGGSMPACKGGTSCVECTADSDCTAHGYKKCDQSKNTCLCAQKSGGNLIADSGFDSMSILGWGYDSMAVSWDPADNDNCMRSGSVKIGSGSSSSGQLTQCVGGVSGGTQYTFGFRYKQDTPSTALCLVSYATGIDGAGDCINPAGPDLFGVPADAVTSTTTWSSASGSFTTDPGTSYIQVSCKPQQGGTMWIDQAYLTKGSSGTF